MPSAQGCAGDTFFLPVTVHGRVGIAPLSLHLPYSLSPNPATREIFVEFAAAPPAKISFTLFDPQGRRLRQQQSREPRTRLDLQGLTAGMYFLEIRAGEAVGWEKVWVR